MSSENGRNISLTVFGESHARAVGAVIEGLPAGEEIDEELIMQFMRRRMGGKPWSTPRREEDKPVILCGLLNGKTTGAALCAIIENNNTRPADYENMKKIPRPSHADYPAFVKYNGANDRSGGGQFSGRLTAPLCAAGAICEQILERRGVKVAAHLSRAAGVDDKPFDPCNPDGGLFEKLKLKEFPVIDDEAGGRMIEQIIRAKGNMDSVGGVVECAVTGLEPGLGEPIFGSVESRLSSMIFGIGGVRGIEFGAGFLAADMTGSLHNDPYCIVENEIKTVTNNHGGIIGGLTSGMPIIFRAAFKPTSSIGLPQRSVDLDSLEETKLEIRGRHDPCIAVRAVPCVEAAAAVTVLDILMSK